MSQQIQLPYEAITEVASRDVTRQSLKRAGDIYKIDIRKVKIREGFNGRYRPLWMSEEDYYNKELEIPEMAALLKAGGQEEPIEGDFLSDGTFIITEGQRRTMGMRHLIEHDPEAAEQFIEDHKGEQVHMIKVIRNPTGFTELQRMLRISTSQEKLKLKPMEIACLVLRVKKAKEDGGEYSNDELKDLFGKSRQWIDNMVSLATLPEETRIKVEKGELSPTEALAQKREEKKAAKEPKESDADKYDTFGYLISKRIKDPIARVSDAFVNAEAWIEWRMDQIAKLGFEGLIVFREWHRAFARMILTNNIEYKTTLPVYVSDFETWYTTVDHDADPTKLFLSDNEESLNSDVKMQAGPAVFDGSSHTGFFDEEGKFVQPESQYGPKPAIHDTTSMENQDDGLQKGTDSKFKEPRAKKDQDGDALGKIDFKKEKTEADMDLNEIKRNADKVSVMLDRLNKDKGQMQMRDDAQRLLKFIVDKANKVQETLKKAADER